MGGPLERYQRLGIKESLSRIYQYPSACKELGLILKLSYSKFPKNLQSLIFQDVLAAFRLLPQMQTQTAISAANILLQSAESALPKQKKVMTVTEFKHAMVAHKRRSKARHGEEDSAQLPEDILVHVFSFLDFRSLLSASLVCRLWNAASRDNHVWRLQYVIFFDASKIFSKINLLDNRSIENEKYKCLQDNVIGRGILDWRTVFKQAYKGIQSKKFITSSRGFCKHCNVIVWLSDMANEAPRLKCRYHQIKPISTRQIAEYLEGDSASIADSSDSDSDSDGDGISKLWVYPRRMNELSL